MRGRRYSADVRRPSGDRVSHIDRSSPVPYYYQLRQILEAQVSGGALQVDDRLPSESALCDEFEVSRTVVRQALADLENEGLIRRVKGKGSFIAAPKTSESLVQSLTSLHEDVQARGQRLRSRILRLEAEPVSAHVATLLDLAPSDRIILLERLRLVNGLPWVVTTNHLPYDLCSRILDLDMRDRSLYETLEDDLGIPLDHGWRSVDAALAGNTIGRHLGIGADAPVLRLTGVTFDTTGRPVEYFVSAHRGDSSRFQVDVNRSRSVDPDTGIVAVTS
jgi:GntR family transcriptional regulator